MSIVFILLVTWRVNVNEVVKNFVLMKSEDNNKLYVKTLNRVFH